MTKKELVEAYAARNNCTLAQALKAIDDLCHVLQDGLSKGHDMPLGNLGNLKVKATAERNGRNPKTGETILIPSKKKAVFSPSKALREAVSA